MTLAELSTAWNDLRNAALGRGTAPLVSAPLALAVGRAWEGWRAYYDGLGVSAAEVPTLSSPEWIDRYRELAERVTAERGTAHFRAAPGIAEPTFIEQAGTLVRALGLAAAAGIALGTIALVAQWRRGGRS